VGVFIWSGRRLGLDEAPKRAWIISVAIVLSAQALAGLSLPLRSRAWRLIGWFLVAFSAIAFVYHPNRAHLLVMRSLSVPVSLGVLLGTFVAGAGLLVMQALLAARTAPGGPAGQTSRLPCVLIPSALLLGAVVFAEANGAMSRKELVGSVVSLSLRDGSPRWVRETLPCRKRRRSVHNTPATPTAVTDGQRVVAWFGSAGVVCLDMHGRILWANPQFRSEPKYGAVSSPVLKDGILVLVSDLGVKGRHRQGAQSWIAGLDAATGECLWQQPRQSHPEYAGYATPVVETRAGRGVVWVHGWHGLDGYDLQTGEPLCRYAYEFKARHLVAGPVLEGDRLFIPGADIHRCADLARLLAGEDPLLWSRKAAGDISATPVVAGGFVFLVDERGKAVCLDLATGAVEWEERLPGLYWASPVLYGGRVCFLSEKGLLTVVAAERAFKVLARHDLGESVHASPAVVGNLLVRTDEGIHCIRRPGT
jgi:outer membrane protein assembly factor BamB